MELKLRADDLEWRLIDDEVVALDSRSAQYLTIRGSGVVLWEALGTGMTRESLVGILVDRYGIDADRATADTDGFLADLTEKGLLA